MKTLGIRGPGQCIRIIKANDIIPMVVWASPVDGTFALPATCPICGQELSIRNDGSSEFLVCENVNCAGKFALQLEHFVSKKGVDIKGLSRQTINKLLEWGWLDNLTDIYKLRDHRSEWINKPGFGPSSVDKILDAIEAASQNVPLSKFIASLGIPLVGTRMSKQLADMFKTWEAFRACDDYTMIDGIGDEINYALIGFDYTEAQALLDYITLEEPILAPESVASLEGLSFVITGSLNSFANRHELVNYIEHLGGKVVGSVSKNTNYLINNDINSTSSKNRRAKELGIPIITEQDLLEMGGIYD